MATETAPEVINRPPTQGEPKSDLGRQAEKFPSEPSVALEAPLLRRGFPLRHLRSLAAAHVGANVGVAETLNHVVAGHRRKDGSLFVLWGKRGTGKTQIAVNAAFLFPKHEQEHKHPRYAKASDIFSEVRAAFRQVSTTTEAAVVADYVMPRLLVIDEAQERGETDFEDRVLTHIIDKRYDAMLHTILISNLTREQLGKSLGPSIVSRVHETGEVIECNWPSFREKEKN